MKSAKAKASLSCSESAERADWLSTLEQISPAAIYRTDAQGKCVWVNRKWSELTGLTSLEAKGDGWQQAIHPGDRERVYSEWEHSSSGGRLFNCEYRYRRPDGVETWVIGSVAEERDADGQCSGFIGMSVDITGLRSAGAAIRQNGGEQGAHELTSRERDVARQLGEGRSNKAIAATLGLSVRTVEAHRARIMRKLRIKSLADLVKYAIRRGLIAPID